MKKLLYTFLAVSIIFAACKKEEENNNPTGTTTIVYGCTDTNAINYNPTATVDDSSCT
jgi:nitrous oxide reductase accessory protein NosL